MVQQLFNDVEKLKAEVRRLRGRIDSFSVGSQIVPGSSPDSPVPTAILEGDIIQATSALLWGRYPYLWLKSSAAQNLTAASNTILATRSHIQLTANADYVMSSTPTIANGVDGQVLVIVNTDATNIITLQDDAFFAGSNLSLSTDQVEIAPGKMMALMFSSNLSLWVQMTGGGGGLGTARFIIPFGAADPGETGFSP